jgi:hypothetical protein
MYLKAIERILWIAYGNHTQTSQYRELAEIITQRLRNDDFVKKQTLMEEVGLDPSSENDDQKFKRVMRPLKGQKSSNPLDIQFVIQRQMDDGSYYALSRDAFDASSRNVVQSIRRVIDSEPHQQVRELKQRVRELEKRLEGGEGSAEGRL